ncbi:hypothetical protein Nmel_005795 [Mimus melanotis]
MLTKDLKVRWNKKLVGFCFYVSAYTQYLQVSTPP